jgi:hypothetical protein
MCFVQMNLLRAATTNTWGEFSPPPQTQYQLHISPTVPYSHLSQLYSLALAARTLRPCAARTRLFKLINANGALQTSP